MLICCRVINTLKSIVQDEDADKEDLHILNDMKQFIMEPEVSKTPGVKALLTLIERAVSSCVFVNAMHTKSNIASAIWWRC